MSGGTVDLLIGTDFPDAFIDMHVIPGNAGEPIGKRNCFGWYVMGRFASQENQPSRIHSIEVGTINAVEDIKKLLTQDMLGVEPTELCTCSDNDLRENKFIKSITKSTQIIDGRVQVRMPWKDEGPPKESNYDIAYKRMISSEKTFKRKDCLEVIQDKVQKLLEQGFVKEVPPEQINHETPEWYLPLQAIFTPDRTTKVRLVFDASAQGRDGKSLNDHLEKGPNYINSLPNVFIAWRFDKEAYTGDVRKMFNQVKIHPDDQMFHRFLWSTSDTEQPRVYQWLRLNFGDKPAPDIAAAAMNTLAKASEVKYPEAAKDLRTHVYVDDVGGSRESEAKCKQITSEIDAILQTGQFRIKAWHSNNENVDQTDEEFTDFLGHKWNKAYDKFTFKKSSIVSDGSPLTKRNCLPYLTQLWDPMGLVTPATIELRIDLQELWIAGYSWDEILPKESQTKWMENVQVLNQLLQFEFSRKLKPDNAVGLPEIHGFCDGGEKAYGSALFLRWKLADGSYSCIPLMVKAFVAPLKKKSIPRLELMGCLSLARLYSTCKEALQFAEISHCKKVFWIDSQTVLTWLKTSPRKFKAFVSVRVAEIQETIGSEACKYIRSDHNLADVLTRGISPEKLKTWSEGPPFLKLPEPEWPKFQENPKESGKELSEEMKRLNKFEAVNTHERVNYPATSTERVDSSAISSESNDNPILEHLMKSCSTFTKARRTLAYVLRFANNTRLKAKKKNAISPDELRESELWLFKWSQRTINVDSSIR